ncbi:MAG TPA: hypothetical protein VMW42_08365 [Desulfatiglandales bacterium]|nr:hypothetical protein [Desulfatiglandales bacterium]
MQRIAWLDTPGLLHHIMVRGIEEHKIFSDNTDLVDLARKLDITPSAVSYTL